MIALLRMATALALALNVSAPFDPVGPLRNFAFDDEDGRYSNNDTVVVCPVNAVQGTVRFTRYGKSTQWVPVFNICSCATRCR